MRGSGRWGLGLRLAVGVVVALTSAACDGGDGADEAAPRPAGKPVRIGFVNLEGAPVGSIPELRIGAEVAVDYLNAERGGLGGRPIDLEVCITNGSPEASAACANQMVERGVVAVVGGVDLGSSASLPILAAAGIPYLGATPLLPADFTTDGAFTLDPGGLGVAASAAFAVDELAAKRVAVLHDDSAQGRQLAEVFVRPVLLDRGLEPSQVELIAEKADAPDVAPALAAATRSTPDAVIVVFPPPHCSRVMQAASTLGVKAAMFYIGRCAGPRAVEAGGAGADGAYFFSSILNVDAHADHPDVRLYRSKVDEFGGSDVDAGSYDTARGFATTMTFYERLSTLEGEDITPSTVTEAFRAAVGAPAFMGHPYTCDGRQAVPGFVSLCNAHVRIYQLVDGRYRDASGDWISAAAALPG
ncbi:MAG TPA: ABC transporter substrate-binding protein [Acidimicrobiales bacterium]|nr:ABC transporter substrate-binding protein [Acidimicrobiales bacterium]